MSNEYAIEFGFDMGEARLGQVANLQWGMAASTDGGETWQHRDPRKPIDQNAQVTVAVFNISDSQGLGAQVDGGTISSIKASDSSTGQKESTPWSRAPTVRVTPNPDDCSAGLGLENVPRVTLCTFTAANEGHFAITLEITVNGHDYTFREDPELVVGGGGGSGQ